MDFNLNDVLQVVTNSQELAAGMQLRPELFGVSSEVIDKGGKDYTTAVDRLVEEEQRKLLKKDFPEVGFLGEEGTSDISKRYIWIVDPTDGTAVFTTGGKYFSNSVALADRDAGKILFSSVYHPETSRQFIRMKGDVLVKEALVNKRWEEDTITRIPVPSKTKSIADSLGCSFGTSFHYDKAPSIKEKLERVFSKSEVKGLDRKYGAIDARPASGSSALFVSEIADGRRQFAILYFQKAWDLAACAPYARDAGCIVNVMDNQGNFTEDNLEAVLARCDEDTLLNVSVFCNKYIQEGIMEKFNGVK